MEPKTVWILGAGFSRPLGGPLLPELLSSGSIGRLRACYSEVAHPLLYGPAAAKARELYKARGPASTMELWGDAEQYLDALDAAVFGGDSSPAWKLIASASGTGPGVPQVADVARRLMVAECCAFLQGADPRTEKWEPYKKWSAQLGSSDAVVTFNYDLVLERLVAEGGRLEVLVPGQSRTALEKCPVYKLHGSVDWRRDAAGSITAYMDAYALSAPVEHTVVASPGPSKKKETERLEGLWQGAENELRQANAIVFVGYRFPETDSISRQCLLAAIGGNRQPIICLHTVLGSNTSEPAPRRLRGMLGHSLRLQSHLPLARPFKGSISAPQTYYTLDLHPLFAQDFLDLYAPAHLVQAYRFEEA